MWISRILSNFLYLVGFVWIIVDVVWIRILEKQVSFGVYIKNERLVCIKNVIISKNIIF